MKKIWLFTALFLCLILVACSDETFKESTNHQNESEDGNSTIENKNGVKLVVSEKKLPSNFHEIAVQRKEVPYFNYFVKKVDKQTHYEETWRLFNLEQQIPIVDFEANDLYFIGVQESGSCPYVLEDKDMFIEDNVLNINLSNTEGGCTLVATARTFVIEVNKENSSDMKNIVISESDVETTVPINVFK